MFEELVPAVADDEPHSLELEVVELDVVASVAVVADVSWFELAVVADVESAEVEALVAVDESAVAVALRAKAPVRARNVPALTTAAVRRAPWAGCGRRRRGRGAGVVGGVVASMGTTMRPEPESPRRAAGEVAVSSCAVAGPRSSLRRR